MLGSGATLAAPSVMAVSTSSLVRGAMPSRYTCAVPKAVSPPINWTGAPKGTQSIAIVFDDSDAPITPYVYWLAFDIGPGTSAILDGQLPPGAKQARGSAGYGRYNDPTHPAQKILRAFNIEIGQRCRGRIPVQMAIVIQSRDRRRARLEEPRRAAHDSVERGLDVRF